MRLMLLVRNIHLTLTGELVLLAKHALGTTVSFLRGKDCWRLWTWAILAWNSKWMGFLVEIIVFPGFKDKKMLWKRLFIQGNLSFLTWTFQRLDFPHLQSAPHSHASLHVQSGFPHPPFSLVSFLGHVHFPLVPLLKGHPLSCACSPHLHVSPQAQLSPQVQALFWHFLGDEAFLVDMLKF